jgi:hypothetical protein
MSYVAHDADAAGHVRRRVAAAFDSAERIAEDAAYIYETDEARVAGMVADAVAERAKEVASWPAVTDCDHLDRAFATLNAAGVLARQNFACCNSCGHGEMFDLVHQQRERGRAIDGYVFYHQQDTDRVVGGDGLHLRYASMSGGRDAAVALGRRVVSALAAEGLAVEWDEDPSRTIHVSPFDWKRRAAPSGDELLDAPWTAESALARWCEALPGLSAAEFAADARDAYGESLGAVAGALEGVVPAEDTRASGA